MSYTPHTDAAQRHEQRVAAQDEAAGWSLPEPDYYGFRRKLRRYGIRFSWDATHEQVRVLMDAYDTHSIIRVRGLIRLMGLAVVLPPVTVLVNDVAMEVAA